MAETVCPICGFDRNEPDQEFCTDCGTELKARCEVIPTKVKKAVEVVAQASGEGAKTEILPDRVFPPQITTLPKAKLIVRSGGRIGYEFCLMEASVNIGRWDANSGAFPQIDLTEDDPGTHVSRKHARIFFKDGKYFIEDLGSTNGTFVNKVPRLTPNVPQELKSGDEIILGKTFLSFLIE